MFARKLKNDYTRKYRIRKANQEDWFYITFEEDGEANFCISPQESKMNVDLYLLKGEKLSGHKDPIAHSTRGAGLDDMILNVPVKGGEKYFMKVKYTGGSMGYYTIRAKNYPLTASKEHWSIDVNIDKDDYDKRRGSLVFKASSGGRVTKRITCACRCQGTKDKNSPDSWKISFGNTPTGTAKGETGGPNLKKDNHPQFPYKYGPNKFIRLTPTSGDFLYIATHEPYRDGIMIHGGRNPNPNNLWNTGGCVRVPDASIKEITQYIDRNCEKYGVVSIQNV